VLFVIPQKGLYLPDYQPVRRRLEENGIEVVTVSTSREPCLEHVPNGPVGGPTAVRADLVLNDVRPEDYRGVIFCGGDASEFFPRDQMVSVQLRRILRPMKDDRNKVIAAIC